MNKIVFRNCISVILILFLCGISLIVFALSNEKIRDSIVTIANQQYLAKKQYVAGTQGPDTFDCSGLVYYSYSNSGIKISRLNAAGYYNICDVIDNDKDILPGDLVFLRNSDGVIHHVGIYVGNGSIIAAKDETDGVVEEKLSGWRSIGEKVILGRLKSKYWLSAEIPIWKEDLPQKPDNRNFWEKTVDFFKGLGDFFQGGKNSKYVQSSISPLTNSENNSPKETPQSEIPTPATNNNQPSNLQEAAFKAFASACDITASGSLEYSPDLWKFANSSNQDEFVDGTFTNKNGCKVDVWLGSMGSFCGIGDSKAASCNEQFDQLTINGNTVSRNFATKGSEFMAGYDLHIDDKSCCNEAGCGHEFDFSLEASSADIGKKCMVDFEELLKTFQLKKDILSKPTKNTTDSLKSDNGNEATKTSVSKAAVSKDNPPKLPGKITAFVIDQRGQVFSSAAASIIDYKGNTICAPQLTKTGYLESCWLPADTEYTLSIGSYEMDTFTKKVMLPKEGLSLGTLAVHKWSRVKGFVVDENGKPIDNGVFFLEDDKGNSSGSWSAGVDTTWGLAYTITKGGYFETRVVADGKYKFRSKSSGYYDAATRKYLMYDDYEQSVNISDNDVDLGKITLHLKQSQ